VIGSMAPSHAIKSREKTKKPNFLRKLGGDAGEMKSVADLAGLALVRLDAWRAAGGALMAEGAKVTPHVPDWMELSE